jgi:hypothetical protein
MLTTHFFYGSLNEDVYMVQLDGFVHPTLPNHICKLDKALCGLVSCIEIFSTLIWFYQLKKRQLHR